MTDASRGHSGLRNYATEPLLILMSIAGGVLLIVCANVAEICSSPGGAAQVYANSRCVSPSAPATSRFCGCCWWRASSWRWRALPAECCSRAGRGYRAQYFVTPDSPLAISGSPDGCILLFTSGLAFTTAILAGLVPALRSARIDLAPTSRAAAALSSANSRAFGRRSSSHRSRSRSRCWWVPGSSSGASTSCWTWSWASRASG